MLTNDGSVLCMSMTRCLKKSMSCLVERWTTALTLYTGSVCRYYVLRCTSKLHSFIPALITRPYVHITQKSCFQCSSHTFLISFWRYVDTMPCFAQFNTLHNSSAVHTKVPHSVQFMHIFDFIFNKRTLLGLNMQFHAGLHIMFNFISFLTFYTLLVERLNVSRLRCLVKH